LITKSDALYYHSAILIYIEKADARESAEAMIYTPHGVQADSFTAMMKQALSRNTGIFTGLA
jgi:hypothetical protein